METVAVLPTDLDGRHVLAVPAGADVLGLARAWFVDPGWTREPAAPEPAPAMPTGARFRGVVVDAGPVRPGAMRLDEAAALVGPLPVAADEAHARGLPPGGWDLYGTADPTSVRVDEPAPTDAVSRRVSGWLVATARRTRGLVVPADRASVLVPDPGQGVDLTLWSAVPLTPADLVAVVRPAMVGARVGAPEVGESTGSAPVPCRLTATFEYDGQVVVTLARSTTLPVVLTTIDWRASGPWAYRVRWRPIDPDELGSEQPSRLHVIARDRVAPMLARVATALQRAVEGTVVDAGGFVVSPDDLVRRSRPTA
ncbi:hypothetical protein [Cellulomonas composti]|uniref:Uncharacterized protein n=1 Tax=Cellulomonas composti TaxID=266130 RepID=A0A511JEI9_9CELL|nr:hypothetical protein [Cellulomonas composti]GEL96417.1 hypothetical protein CCO02nite_30750 [Cellulomonas composti]